MPHYLDPDTGRRLPVTHPRHPVRLRKLEAGVYETLDGRFRIERDSHQKTTVEERDGIGPLAGCDDDGWCLLEKLEPDTGGEWQVMDWFDTMGAARNELARTRASKP